MEKLRTLLVANRGEIAVRICKTARKLNIRTIAIFSEADAASQHVREADEAVQLSGSNASAYTDEDNIISIAKAKKADAIIPGYGFLSENAHFARIVIEAGLAWVGPSPEAIEEFGVKHVARSLAEKARVPIVPGTKGLVENEDSAAKAAEDIGFPVMLKATGGGGGMGLVTCHNADDVREGFRMVQSRGQALFKNPGIFIEAFYPESHHIEIQVFGNGQGQAIHFGERECSIQRRHQKVIEECPSPFVERNPDLRKKLGDAAVRLAESIKYGSAGTIEYLVDDKSGDFFFLEMNTRLQVEHGITELCYDIDLVELMLKQADAQLRGKGGLDWESLKRLQPAGPSGAAIEARVYAENPLKDFAPSPGLLQKVEWKKVPGSRIDTWVFTGSRITPNYDPLIAKVMVHSDSRDTAITGLRDVLTESSICGPPTNLDFLAGILQEENFKTGNTMTSFLKAYKYNPNAIDVISAGAYTLIQDLPGRPSVGKGIPHSGPMDPLAFQLANILVGNPREKEGLEITLDGPELRFIKPAVVALCGAPMETSLDGSEFPMWTRMKIGAGQKLKIGKTTGGGCRSYLAVYGGFPSVAEYFGSKSTSPLVAIGGYQGRALAPGDLLQIVTDFPNRLDQVSLPAFLRPVYTSNWEIKAMVGPHDDGYFLPEDIEMIYKTKWKISHNASRSGIRLVGPVPKWARKDGGEGGAHPSNLIEYGYPLGTLNWTGDEPCIFPIDCPNFGGFVSSTTVIRADWWKLGQLKAGNTLKYVRVSLEDALKKRTKMGAYFDDIEDAIKTGGSFDRIDRLPGSPGCHVDFHGGEIGKAVVWQKDGSVEVPTVKYRQGGDDHLIIEYGNSSFDLNHRCRVTALENALHSASTPSNIKSNLINTVGCCTTLLLYYNGLNLPRSDLIDHLKSIESSLGSLRTTKVPTRLFKLPLTFESRLQTEATERYMTNQRPHAPYLPDNLAFVARNNAFTPDQLKEIYLNGRFMAVVVGFFCGNTVSLPVDPRQRMSCPKMNPSRVFTPEGSVSWGGSCMSIYPVDSPGGYQMTGRTVPCWDYYGYKAGFSPQRPWLFKDFDILTYYQVSEQEMDDLLTKWRAGKYKFEYEEIEFDMAEHNKLLEDTASEVSQIRERQAKAQEEMVKAENESLEKWRKEKAENQVDEGTVEKLLDDENVVPLEAPVDANVWKVEVKEGDEVHEGTVIAILEAMKLEIAVRTPDNAVIACNEGQTVKVEKLLVKPGDTVSAGGKIVLLRKRWLT
ncbi:allophanate hydrolase subunit 2-domain-containing protein [Dendryphion nanum]|uniref:Allophanate hydrolase subunit 2-domain-containing protein n=1 Tax=Dendryphion nanum TaxID=256645 RepID=A0A9P9DBE4_9PLEO|nr:allophanate hydrolase subunit 2-domain-containing protein [Dendryphion nanum]